MKKTRNICTYLLVFVLCLKCLAMPVYADTPDELVPVDIGDALEVVATIVDFENETESAAESAAAQVEAKTDEESMTDDSSLGEDAQTLDITEEYTQDTKDSDSESANSNADLGITAQAAVLMEASTGTIIYEKNPDESLRPASITKIMTLILIFDALSEGKIKMTDMVTTSAYAKSMGGSQVFLEEGEQQTVETMIKCIVVASGNDASVAMAEHIAGSETEFVRMMNERAQGLGMTNTNFEDCCGLTDSGTHLTSARDVAIMSRELITKYPEISDYSTIWMETIVHETSQGTSEFSLANTNKLLKMSTSFTTTGLKTGSTSLAKYCLSATANKDGVDLIAVVMAAPDYKVRFSEAMSMLNYGFANCMLYKDESPEPLSLVPIANGVNDQVACEYGSSFSYLSTTGEDFSAIEKTWEYAEGLTAPIQKGDKIGSLIYSLNGQEIGRVDIVASEDIKEAGFLDYLKKVWNGLMIEKDDEGSLQSEADDSSLSESLTSNEMASADTHASEEAMESAAGSVEDSAEASNEDNAAELESSGQNME